MREGLKNIKLNDKEIVLIFGNTGSGKTTLAANLSGIELIPTKN